MKAVYVISTPDRIPQNLFKIGRTTQTQEELRRRYLTALITPIILLYIPVDDEIEAEKSLHRALNHFRVEQSEWFNCELSLIVNQITNLQTTKKSEVKMEDDRKLFQWLTQESPLIDFIITSKNPIQGYYRLRVNGQPQNFWVSFPNTGRKGFLEVLRKYIKREAPFWLEKQNMQEIMNEIDPITLVSSSRASAVFRSRLHFQEVNKSFLEFCMDCILSLCTNPSLEMKNRFSSFKDKQGKEENRIIYMDLKKKMMARYVTLSSSVEENLEPRDLEEGKRVALYSSTELPFVEPPPSFINSGGENEDNKLFDKLMRVWISDEGERKMFKEFGRHCLLNSKRGEHLTQVSTLNKDGLMFSYEQKEELQCIDGITIEHYADTSLVSEYLATLINYFFPKSTVRLYGQDGYSWENVKRALTDLSKHTPIFPKLVFIYSSVLRWLPECSFKKMEVKVSQYYSEDIIVEEDIQHVPNYIIISPEHNQLDNFSYKKSSMVSPVDLTAIEQFKDEHPEFIKRLSSSEILWTGLKWFLH